MFLLGWADILGCCGGFIVLPSVVLLISIAWVADAPWAGWTALAIAGLTYLVASLIVADYKPSENWEVVEEQATGWRLVERYSWLTMAAGSSLVAIGVRRSLRKLWPRVVKPKQSLTTAERLAVVDEIESRGLVSLEEATRLRDRLRSTGVDT